ncbi:PTS ascorbate transporter subunit IIC [Helcococcus kunzii]|uniref:PTS ascorbate transporter subunit IIC n=1 Tax=Helcococcus kunzii TaxID=40091 RepID=UPI0021A68CE5|nr:PTS ascorbate transporter subunit IIC [Helcococcus kunzii]MCT1796872.1 PTS ascorbate transporter subunit IIC [Helcococcus kunzii]MCT1989696.1 PTS ascorbate transporter subunit IIC [Helcococcus kunzii]
MDILLNIWKFIVNNIITQPAYFIGFMVLIGYILLKKPWYECLSGFVKATVGYFILAVGSGGLVTTFRPILVGLKERFNLSAMVIDPYFGQNAVQAAMEKIGKSFSQVMILLLVAFIVNLILVRLQKITKLRAVFTTGHVQMQQAAIAFWLVLFCFPDLGETPILIIMALLLGLYWAVGSDLTIKATQELTDGAGFALAHQQMFGVYFMSKLATFIGKRSKSSKRLEDIELPGWLSIFNDNMVSTSILMTLFFGGILLVLGQDYLVKAEFMKPNQSFFFYILSVSFHFAVYLAILQLGVRTFVAELTVSFQGISNKLLPGSVPGIDCAAVFGFGSPNAITIGFLSGALGQFLAIAILILLKSPTIVIAGFVPVFFDNATIGVYSNNKGGILAAIICPFLSGLIQVFGSALIASWVGLASYGGYLGMFDWATVWPAFTGIMKYLGYAGVGLIAIILIIIPQLRYRREKEDYFLLTSDYQEYKRRKQNK